jgi:uncharacterized RDD family membrane protein YckC
MSASSSFVDQPAGSSSRQSITVIGFGRRLIATLIDGILLAFFTFMVAFAIGFVGIFVQMFKPDDTLALEGLIIICGVILSVIYYVGYWSKSGQTIGNTLLGIKVVGQDGSGLSRGKAFLRYIGYIVSGILWSIGFLWVAFDRKRQGWHDKIVGTYVIYADDEFSGADEVEFTPSDAHQRDWIWLVLWVIFAIVAPAALGGSLWVLGPVVSRLLVNIAGQ